MAIGAPPAVPVLREVVARIRVIEVDPRAAGAVAAVDRGGIQHACRAARADVQRAGTGRTRRERDGARPPSTSRDRHWRSSSLPSSSRNADVQEAAGIPGGASAVDR
jgi:hypothetical protein